MSESDGIKKIRNFVYTDIAQNLDITVCLIGILCSLAAISFLIFKKGVYTYIEAPITVLIVSLLYLFVRRKEIQPDFLLKNANKNYSRSRSTTLVLNIIFFLLVMVSISVLYFRQDPYTRPILFFILIALLYSLVAIDIATLPKHKMYMYITLVKCVFLSEYVILSSQILFPSLVGIDVHSHGLFTEKILDFAHIPEGFAYSNAPITHLITGTAVLITNLDFKTASILSIGLDCAIILLSVFIITTSLANYKLGLFAALSVGIADSFIRFSIFSIPNTVGYIFILLLLLLIITKSDTRNRMKTYSYLIMLFLLLLIATHPLSAYMQFVILLLFWISAMIYWHIFPSKDQVALVTGAIVSFFFVAMIMYWMYISGHMWYIADTIKYTIDMDFAGYEGFHGNLATLSYSSVLMNRLGWVILFGVSIFGIFLSMSKKILNVRIFCLLIFMGFITFVALIGSALGFTYLIAERWLTLSEILMAIPLAFSLGYLASSPQKVFTAIAIFGIFFCLSFFCITNNTANMDSPVYTNEAFYRMGYSSSELQFISTIRGIYQGNIATDATYSYLMNGRGLNAYDFINNIMLEKLSDMQDIFVVRESCIQNTFFWPKHGLVKITLISEENSELLRFNHIYNSRAVNAYFPRLP